MEGRINSLKYGFCKDCSTPFEIDFSKKIAIKDLCCPNCSSHSIVSSTSLTKAISENRPLNELLDVVAKDDFEMKRVLKMNEMRRNS